MVAIFFVTFPASFNGEAGTAVQNSFSPSPTPCHQSFPREQESRFTTLLDDLEEDMETSAFHSLEVASVAKLVVLKFEKPSKIPHFHKFVSFEVSIQEPKFPKSELKFPITSVNSSNLGENLHALQHWWRWSRTWWNYKDPKNTNFVALVLWICKTSNIIWALALQRLSATAEWSAFILHLSHWYTIMHYPFQRLHIISSRWTPRSQQKWDRWG